MRQLCQTAHGEWISIANRQSEEHHDKVKILDLKMVQNRHENGSLLVAAPEKAVLTLQYMRVDLSRSNGIQFKQGPMAMHSLERTRRLHTTSMNRWHPFVRLSSRTLTGSSSGVCPAANRATQKCIFRDTPKKVLERNYLKKSPRVPRR